MKYYEYNEKQKFLSVTYAKIIHVFVFSRNDFSSSSSSGKKKYGRCSDYLEMRTS